MDSLWQAVTWPPSIGVMLLRHCLSGISDLHKPEHMVACFSWVWCIRLSPNALQWLTFRCALIQNNFCAPWPCIADAVQ